MMFNLLILCGMAIVFFIPEFDKKTDFAIFYKLTNYDMVLTRTFSINHNLMKTMKKHVFHLPFQIICLN